MPKKSRVPVLMAWINGKLAGEWRIPNRGDMEFRYDPAWAESEEGRPLSLSLPLTLDNLPIKGQPVQYYFDNLLPDSEPIRKRFQERFQTTSRDAFSLLEAIGRDCVGAVQLLPPGEIPDIQKIDAKPLADADIEKLLFGVVSPNTFHAPDLDDSFRISIAGAQEKTALLRHANQWCLPIGATPTTHIFKLPLGRIGNTQIAMRTSVENEWLCAKVLAAYRIPIASCDIAIFGSQKVLVVERFDRRLHPSAKYWLRLIQEDFCQATATPASRKYEENGGPGILDIADILRGSIQRDEDLATFIRAQILFWMLAATDGHAKNFSLHMLPQGRYKLTPLYDVLSAWPVIGHGANNLPVEKAKLAMALRGKSKHYRLKDIQRRHFNQTVSKSGLGETAEPLINEILAITSTVISQVQKEMPSDFPPEVLDSVLAGLQQSAKRLESMPP